MDHASGFSRRGLLTGAAGLAGAAAVGAPPVSAAETNAVFNATGKRIRDLPIRAEQLL